MSERPPRKIYMIPINNVGDKAKEIERVNKEKTELLGRLRLRENAEDVCYFSFDADFLSEEMIPISFFVSSTNYSFNTLFSALIVLATFVLNPSAEKILPGAIKELMYRNFNIDTAGSNLSSGHELFTRCFELIKLGLIYALTDLRSKRSEHTTITTIDDLLVHIRQLDYDRVTVEIVSDIQRYVIMSNDLYDFGNLILQNSITDIRVVFIVFIVRSEIPSFQETVRGNYLIPRISIPDNIISSQKLDAPIALFTTFYYKTSLNNGKSIVHFNRDLKRPIETLQEFVKSQGKKSGKQVSVSAASAQAEAEAEAHAIELINSLSQQESHAKKANAKKKKKKGSKSKGNDVEADDVETDGAEAERVEAKRLEAEILEAERLEAARVEAERLEAARLEAQLVRSANKAQKKAIKKAERDTMIEEDRKAMEREELERGEKKQPKSLSVEASEFVPLSSMSTGIPSAASASSASSSDSIIERIMFHGKVETPESILHDPRRCIFLVANEDFELFRHTYKYFISDQPPVYFTNDENRGISQVSNIIENAPITFELHDKEVAKNVFSFTQGMHLITVIRNEDERLQRMGLFPKPYFVIFTETPQRLVSDRILKMNRDMTVIETMINHQLHNQFNLIIWQEGDFLKTYDSSSKDHFQPITPPQYQGPIVDTRKKVHWDSRRGGRLTKRFRRNGCKKSKNRRIRRGSKKRRI
jgi:hypothetical protein